MSTINSNPTIGRLEETIYESADGSKVLPVMLVTESGDTLQPVVSSGGGGDTPQQVTVQNFPKWSLTDGILTGMVDPTSGSDYPKLIETTSANAIEIQCPQENTAPLLVSNMQMDFGDWEVYPGTSKVFYTNKLYVRTSASTAQKVTFMAVSYS